MTLALIQIGEVLENAPIKAITSAMTAILVVLWLFVAVAHIIAVCTKQILWKGQDEDDGMDLRTHKEKKRAKEWAKGGL